MAEYDVQDEAVQAGFWRRHWKIVLRVAIYGSMALLVAIAAIGLFLPVEEPATVKRIAAEKTGSAPHQKPVHASTETTTATQTVAQPERIDPDYLDQRFDQIRMRMVNYESLFNKKENTIDAKKIVEVIQKRVATLKGRIDAIDLASRTQDYKKTNEAIHELGEELDYLVNSIDVHLIWKDGKFVRLEKYPDWAKDGQAAFIKLANDLEQRELEHLVRHEHWATAAKLSEYRRDYVQAIYYWRKAGGYDGRLRSVLSGISIPLQNSYRFRGINQKTLADRIFFVGVPEEDNQLFLKMLTRNDWRM